MKDDRRIVGIVREVPVDGRADPKWRRRTRPVPSRSPDDAASSPGGGLLPAMLWGGCVVLQCMLGLTWLVSFERDADLAGDVVATAVLAVTGLVVLGGAAHQQAVHGRSAVEEWSFVVVAASVLSLVVVA